MSKPQLQAYSLATKEKVPMNLTHVYRTSLVGKDGKKTGKFRYRLAGTTFDGKHNLSKLVSESDANAFSKAFGVKITNQKGNVPKERRSCKERIKKALAKVSAKKPAKRTSAKKPAAKKASAKKPAAKKASVKKPAAKKASVKKPAGKPSVKVVMRRGAKAKK